MFGILSLGFLLGMHHALEADHIAAVSSIAARRSSVREIVKHGLTWGIGHTITLSLFAGAALLLGQMISDHLAERLELCSRWSCAFPCAQSPRRDGSA